MSNQRKLPHTLTEEELLKIIEQEDDTTVPQEELANYPALQNDVIAFLSHYGLEEGDDTVPRQMIYYLYNLWSKEPVTRLTFYTTLAKFFMQHQKGPRWYYLLNRSSMNLTNEAFKLLNEQTRNKVKSLAWRNHFENFLAKYNISSGKFFIEWYILYDLYDQYCYEINRKQPMSQPQFLNFCKIYFSTKRLARQCLYIGLNESLKEILTEERITTLKRQRRLRREKHKEKAKNFKKK